MIKVAFILTHPIQYFSPFFKELAKRKNIEFIVFYTLGDNKNEFDVGFNLNVKWDVDLLDGYNYYFANNISQYPNTNSFNGMDCPDLISDILNYSPDKIVVFGWNYKCHLKVLRYFKNKIPIYFRGDSTFIDDQGFAKKIIRVIYLKFFVYKYIDYAFYVGINNKDYFLKCGLKENQLLYFPYSINSSFYCDKPTKVNPEKINILYVGKLQNKKNPLLLIKAILALGDYPLYLKIIGDGELKSDIVKYLSNRIQFCGFKNQTEIVDIYKKADILIMPSSGPNETWGLVLNEAAASGLALIASNRVGGALDMIHEGRNGYIFKNNDLIDLIDKILLIINDISCLNVMKQNSIEIANKYKLDNTIDIFESNIFKK